MRCAERVRTAFDTLTEGVLVLADQALYLSKKGGRNRVTSEQALALPA